MRTMYVKPEKGRRIRDPRTGQPIPEKGLNVPVDKFWMRRLADYDVSEVEGKRRDSKKQPDASKPEPSQPPKPVADADRKGGVK